MDEQSNCPLCGSNTCTIAPLSSGTDGYLVECRHYDVKFKVLSSIYASPQNENLYLKRQLFNCIASFLLRTLYCGEVGKTYWEFYYDRLNEIDFILNDLLGTPEHHNIAFEFQSYPTTIGDRLDKTLVNLSIRYPGIGTNIPLDDKDAALYYCDSFSHPELVAILDYLTELNYLSGTQHRNIITARGWQRIAELSKAEHEINQGFIAMSFGNSTKSIGAAFAKAITQCGYVPRRIDEKQHNNQIVPEILFEIARSRFLVVDVTVPNYGAYYEAGYGEALGKQVIVCCRKDIFEGKDKPHFDIAQKSAVVWENETDLIKRLTERIEATVGKNI